MEYYRFRKIYFTGRILSDCVKGLLFIGFVLFFIACSSIRNIEIEVSELPEYPVADDVQTLVLLNRSMNMQFSNLSSDSLEHILVQNKMQLDTLFRDSIAADTVIHSAALALFNSGRFDVVIPKMEIIDRNDFDEIGKPLNANSIIRLCKDYNADAALILEGFSEQVATEYRYRSADLNSQYYGSEFYSATTDIDYKSEWRLYRPETTKPAIRFQIRDSIFWSANSTTLRDLYTQMPKTKEALIGGGIASGQKMAQYISPKWTSRVRHYFMTGKTEIDAAVPLILENKWDEANAIWLKYSNVESKRVRGKVEFNLALAAEMSGNLDLAIEWGLKSFKTSYCFAIEEYLRTLEFTRKVKSRETKQRF